MLVGIENVSFKDHSIGIIEREQKSDFGSNSILVLYLSCVLPSVTFIIQTTSKVVKTVTILEVTECFIWVSLGYALDMVRLNREDDLVVSAFDLRLLDAENKVCVISNVIWSVERCYEWFSWVTISLVNLTSFIY